MALVRVRALRDVKLSLDGIHVRTHRAGEVFAAPERVVRGQIGLGALERADVPPPPPASSSPSSKKPEPAEPATYEAKPAPYETAVLAPARDAVLAPARDAVQRPRRKRK